MLAGEGAHQGDPLKPQQVRQRVLVDDLAGRLLGWRIGHGLILR